MQLGNVSERVETASTSSVNALDGRSRQASLLLLFDKRHSIVLVEAKGFICLQNGWRLPQGTLDLLMLKAIARGPQHGWGISERLYQISHAAFLIRQGSIYPGLHRLERRGWIKASWATSDNNRRAKYYQLTRCGRVQLEAQSTAWRKLAAAIGEILETT